MGISFVHLQVYRLPSDLTLGLKCGANLPVSVGTLLEWCACCQAAFRCVRYRISPRLTRQARDVHHRSFFWRVTLNLLSKLGAFQSRGENHSCNLLSIKQGFTPA